MYCTSILMRVLLTAAFFCFSAYGALDTSAIWGLRVSRPLIGVSKRACCVLSIVSGVGKLVEINHYHKAVYIELDFLRFEGCWYSSLHVAPIVTRITSRANYHDVRPERP